MNNKEVVKTIRHIFDQYYFLRDECKADSLLRIDRMFSCEDCALTDTVSTEEVMCPFVTEREVKVFR